MQPSRSAPSSEAPLNRPGAFEVAPVNWETPQGRIKPAELRWDCFLRLVPATLLTQGGSSVGRRGGQVGTNSSFYAPAWGYADHPKCRVERWQSARPFSGTVSCRRARASGVTPDRRSEVWLQRRQHANR